MAGRQGHPNVLRARNRQCGSPSFEGRAYWTICAEHGGNRGEASISRGVFCFRILRAGERQFFELISLHRVGQV